MKKIKHTGIFFLLLGLFYFGYYLLSWNEMPNNRKFQKTTAISDTTFKEQIQVSSKKHRIKKA